MKKTASILNLSVFVLFTFMVSCTGNKNKKDEAGKFTGVPSQIISVKQAIAMKQKYQKEVATAISNSKSYPGTAAYEPTEFAYVELDTLKKYIAFLDEVQKKNKSQKITGLRIYFAAYPKEKVKGYKMRENDRETLFFAPTTNLFVDKNKVSPQQNERTYLQNIPFYIAPTNAKDKYVGTFRPINQLLYHHDVGRIANQHGIAQLKVAEPDSTSLIMNDLYICPPPKR